MTYVPLDPRRLIAEARFERDHPMEGLVVLRDHTAAVLVLVGELEADRAAMREGHPGGAAIMSRLEHLNWMLDGPITRSET